MVNKIKLKYLNKRGYDYIFSDEDGNEQVCKIHNTKPFHDKLVEGNEYFVIMNQNWINQADPVDPEDALIEDLVNNELKPKPKVTAFTEHIGDYERQLNILRQHYGEETLKIIDILYRCKDIKDINEEDIFDDYERIIRKLLTHHEKWVESKK